MFGSDQSSSIRSSRQKRGGNAKAVVLFFIGLVLVLLIALWTGSHNVPMMMKGTVEMFRLLGGAAALSGEVLLLVCYVLPFFTAGTQRIATIGVGVWTFFVLLFNSIVGYAQLAAHNQTFDQIVDFYGGYIAPFPIFITVFFGVMLIVETSEDIRARNAAAAAKVQEQRRKTDMHNWVQEQTDAMFEQMPEVHDVLKAGAIVIAVAEAKATFRDYTGREPTDAELETALAHLNRQAAQPKSLLPFQPASPSTNIPVHLGGNGKGQLPNAS